MPNHSIAGEWRGHYQYRHRPDHGCSFSAFISEKSGQIEGTIVDDFFPGKATLTGSFSFPSLQFIKVYCKPGQVIEDVKKVGNTTRYTVATFGHPVQYDGSMSEDGKTLNGTWTIASEQGLSSAGTWTAYRFEEEENKKELDKTSSIKEEQLEEHLLP